MSHLNRVNIIGVIDEDPALLENSKGRNFIKLRVKTVEKYQKDGEQKSHATWHDVEYWGRDSVALHSKLSKGLRCWIEGKSKVRLFEKDGKKHTFHYIQSNTIEQLREA